MAQWHCFKCKEEMREEEIPMEYMDIDGEGEGIECPKCGVRYILEEYATTKVLKAEQMIENK
jgi:DNA-directed RNA polymerase subunit RPC12/RpoP